MATAHTRVNPTEFWNVSECFESFGSAGGCLREFGSVGELKEFGRVEEIFAKLIDKISTKWCTKF